jgi:hypothetical protein
MGGRPTQFEDQWKEIGCSNKVLDCINNGIYLEINTRKIIKINQKKIKEEKWVRMKVKQ